MRQEGQPIGEGGLAESEIAERINAKYERLLNGLQILQRVVYSWQVENPVFKQALIELKEQDESHKETWPLYHLAKESNL